MLEGRKYARDQTSRPTEVVEGKDVGSQDRGGLGVALGVVEDNVSTRRYFNPKLFPYATKLIGKL